jgi:NAD(P)-dependent dehydrogenase (short-subunit alcohol dehydrogenase family)
MPCRASGSFIQIARKQTMSKNRFEGRVAVITGAGGGVGRQLALKMAAEGARIVCLDISAEAATRTADEVGGLALAADIADETALAEAAAKAQAAIGPCDILVNNAAIVRNGSLMDMPLSDWDTILRVNLTGYLICARAFGRQMRDSGRGGSIVHISSIAGHHPQPNSGGYSVSKAGVSMLSRHLAQEWGPYGIRSNVVCPAMMITPMSQSIYKDENVRRQREGVVPLRRIGDPAFIADAVCQFASDEAIYVTGQEIVVDGGWGTTLLASIPRPGFDSFTKSLK